MMARKKKERPYPWTPEKRTSLLFSGWEMDREERHIEKEMISFAHSTMSPSECYTPTGSELYKLQTLINAALVTPVLPDRPKLFLNVPYGGFSIRDPFVPRDPRSLEDEPLFARERSDIEETFLVAHGYMGYRVNGSGKRREWHTDPGRELEKYLAELAKIHLFWDFAQRKHLIGPQPEIPRKRFRLW